MDTKRVLVVYYSRTGFTKKAVLDAAKYFNCDIESLIDKTSRKGFWGYIKAAFCAVTKKDTNLEDIKYSPKNYEIVILATPVWVSSLSCAIKTYIKEYGKEIKRAALLTTSGSSGNRVQTMQAEELLNKPLVASEFVCQREFRDETWPEKTKAFSECIKDKLSNLYL